MVAKGVIARAMDRLWKKIDRLDVLYICANRDIAVQNIKSLNFSGSAEAAFATRITMLPLEMGKLRGKKVNFVSFTPGTSFRMRSSAGICEERVLLYHLLRRAWGFADSHGPRLVLKNDVRWERWTGEIDNLKPANIDVGLADKFAEELSEHPELREQFSALAQQFQRKRLRTLGADEREAALPLIAKLRQLLATTCVNALEPDIVILDEFQRFRDLMDGEDEVAQLARTLFNYPDAKLLLLSATPYKMYTLHQESAEDDHYRDFIRTVRFLQDDAGATDSFEADLSGYRRDLFRVADQGAGALRTARTAVEAQLRRMMVRTERLTMTAERDGMLVESRQDLGGLQPGDLRAFALLDQVSQQLGAGDMVEYWKSAPYLLNMMDDGYLLKRKFAAQATADGAALAGALQRHQAHLLSWDAIQQYEQVDAGNAKLRTLLANTVEQGAWQLLWVPPSLPYYRAESGPYADPKLQGFTKALVFSAWKVVPKVIAMLASYEAERRAMLAGQRSTDYRDDRNRHQLLRFRRDDGRFSGMSNFTLMYPCWTLARQIDPLTIAAQLAAGGSAPDQAAVAQVVVRRVEELLRGIVPADTPTTGAVDERWYWAVPVLLDRQYAEAQVRRWFSTDVAELAWHRIGVREEDEELTQFGEHVQYLYSWLDGGEVLGRMPDDLVDVVTKTALASPAVTILRAMLRFGSAEETDASSEHLRGRTARAVEGFRSLFNQADAIALVHTLRDTDDLRYWESVLDYCVGGNLQAVMDEYLHIRHDSPALIGKSVGEKAATLAEELARVASLRTASLAFDDLRVEDNRVNSERRSLRCRFALRFGDGKNEENQDEFRSAYVQDAFNSPFRPFILASTSIGQEGLDFHRYCHEIYHWNLPANPVDLEQREGRIHRYKGHVIRRNVARRFGLSDIGGDLGADVDPWALLFERARVARGAEQNDLVPYWIYEVPDGFKVVRHVPALPLSRERLKLEDLRRTLAAYRMVFGQPRQEDLVNYLRSHLTSEEQLQELLAERIDLAPHSWRRPAVSQP